MSETNIKQITDQILSGAGHRLENTEIVERYARELWKSHNFQEHLKRCSIQQAVQEVFEIDDLLGFALDAI